MLCVMSTLHFALGVIGMCAPPFPGQNRHPDEDRHDRKDEAEPGGCSANGVAMAFHRTQGYEKSWAGWFGAK
jgi:hypothetical protein